MDAILVLGLAGAAAANSAAPGPCILVTCSHAATHGLRSGFGVSLGIALSLLILLASAWAMILGMLSISGETWQVLRIAGLAMLVALAISMLANQPGTEASAPVIRRRWQPDWAVGLVAGLSSPWNLMFIFALLPQFVDIGSLDAASIAIATAAVLLGGMLPFVLACLFSAQVLRTVPHIARCTTRLCGAALLVFAGAAIVAAP